MNTERKDEEAIFKAAVQMKSVDERNAYLKRACGNNADLLARVKELLKAYDESGDFLESPPMASDVTLDDSHLTEGPGTRIGRYKLLQLIGEGGFGVVYMAEQEEPILRRVALKIIKLGMDTKQVIARFEAERQALAMMDHPNIARVLDAGATDTGRPYFVMELVKGISITEYCDKNNLDTQQRLELFIDVCKAIQHAHQKGIIHRDIKPSNVMITLHDGKPVPKIIDFGIAKATQQRLTEKTLFTEFRQFVGTPEYMSPEQAEMSGLDVDTRSDIYSLGVLLYELLTGTTPFEAGTLRSAAYDEIRRIIREDEPPRPSTRLSSLGETLTDIAKHRHVQPDELRRIVRGDLDWVVMKALEKDRTRRYETANEFAQDIERHLGDEPVVAGPPSTVYRLRKFARRHRTAVVSGLLVTTAILVGLIVSTTLYIQAVQARRKETAARVQAEQAREKEADARTQAEQAEKIAQQQRKQARRSLARSQIDRGVKLLNEGDALGLLDLLDACITSEDAPEIRESAGRLWAIARDLWASRLVHVMPDGGNLAISPDGRLLVICSDRTAQLWDMATGQSHGPSLALDSVIGAVVFSPDGRLLVAHSVEGVSRLWDTTTGQQVGPTLRHSGSTGKPLEEIWPSLDARWSAAFSPDGKLLATSYLDGTVQLWETSTGQPYGQTLQHEGQVWTVAFSPDGKMLATGASNSTAQVWDVATQLPLCPPWSSIDGKHFSHLSERQPVHKVKFSPDGKLLAIGFTWRVDLLETDTWRPRANLPVGWYIVDLEFNADGKLLAIANYDWTVQLWDTATGQEHGECLQLNTATTAMAFSPDGKLLATASDPQIMLWDVAGGRPYGPVLPNLRTGNELAFSPDGRFLASAGTNIWRTRWQLRTEIVKYRWGTQVGAVSSDGKVGAIVSGYTVQLWDIEKTEALEWDLGRIARVDNISHVDNVTFSPDGKLLAVPQSAWPAESFLRLWDVATGQAAAPPLKTEDCYEVEFSPDGKLLAAATSDSSVLVFEVGTWQLVHELRHSGHIWSVAFSPDRKTLATASSQGTVQLWDVATGRQVGSVLQQHARVRKMAFSPDGKLLAMVLDDQARTVRLWDVARKSDCQSITMPAAVISGEEALSSFTADGTLLIRRYAGGKARVWRLPTPPTDLREMQLRTWIALGAQRNEQGQVNAITWRQWQEFRQELDGKVPAKKPQLVYAPDSCESPEVKLVWTPGSDATAHNVYFGTDPNKLKLMGKVKDACYENVPALDRNATYWWRVDTVKSDGSVIKGNLWTSRVGRLVGWWKFDETEGRKTADSSGNGFNGELVGDARIIVDAERGNVLSLDGDGDYVDCGNASTLDITNEITVAAWVNIRTVAGEWRAIVAKGESAWRLSNSGSTKNFHFGVTIWSALDTPSVNGDTQVATNEWHHVVGTFDGTNINVYLDGVLDGSSPTTEPVGTSVANLLIGENPEAIRRYWDGLIDDVRIYSYALSQAEIAAIYAGQEPKPLDKPKWFVVVSGEEYAPPELQAERDNEYYVPVGLEHDPKEEELLRLEILDIRCRVLVGSKQPENSHLWHERGDIYSNIQEWDKAISDFSKAIEINPDNSDHWHRRADIYSEKQEWDKALADFSKTIELDPNNSDHWYGRANAYANIQQYSQAISDYSRAIELDQNKGYMFYMRALAHLGMGDTEGYRERCADMLERFGKSENIYNAHWAAWTCVLAPNALEDLGQAVKLAELTIESGGKTDQHLNTLGAILYRAGRFDEAVQQLSDLAAEWEEDKEFPTLTSPAYTWFYLAMGYHQLGNADQSQRYFKLAIKRAGEEIMGDTNWNRKLTLRLMRTEAESLLGVSEEAVQKGDETVPQKQE